MIRRKLNKWQLVFDVSSRLEYRNYGWRSCWFGIIKLTSFPDEGEMVQNTNYKGMLLRFMYWLPVQKDY